MLCPTHVVAILAVLCMAIVGAADQSAMEAVRGEQRRSSSSKRNLLKTNEAAAAAAAAAASDIAPGAQRARSLLSATPGPVENFAVVPGINLIDSIEIPQLDLSWDPPTSGDPPTAYKVYMDGVLVESTTATDSYVTQLTKGQRYSFSVTAVNANGESAPVVLSAVAQVQPSAPLNVQAVPGDETLDVYWDPPASDGGAPITGYQVTLDPFMLLDCLPTGQTSCRYTGVINFLAYEVSVLAQAGDLTSAEARVGVAMPRPLPSGPRNFRIVSGGSTTVTLAWDPPTDVDLALPVQGYQISMYQEFPTIPATYSYPLITTVPNTKRSVQLTGLIPGLRYQFGVQAFTAAGPGGMTAIPLGMADGVYAPLGLPQAPQSVAVNGLGEATIRVAWEAPTNTGGVPLKGYRITAAPASRWGKERKRHAKICTTEQCAGEYILTNVEPGMSYTVTVAALNVYGWGPESSPAIVALHVEADPSGNVYEKTVFKRNSKGGLKLLTRKDPRV